MSFLNVSLEAICTSAESPQRQLTSGYEGCSFPWGKFGHRPSKPWAKTKGQTKQISKEQLALAKELCRRRERQPVSGSRHHFILRKKNRALWPFSPGKAWQASVSGTSKCNELACRPPDQFSWKNCTTVFTTVTETICAHGKSSGTLCFLNPCFQAFRQIILFLENSLHACKKSGFLKTACVREKRKRLREGNPSVDGQSPYFL